MTKSLAGNVACQQRSFNLMLLFSVSITFLLLLAVNIEIKYDFDNQYCHSCHGRFSFEAEGLVVLH